MHELYELKEKLMNELNQYSSEELSAGSLEVIDKLTHAIKNICKIIEAAEDEEEYSMRGGQGGGNYSREYRYSREGRGGSRYAYEGGQGSGNRGGSYARGRNARRDSMGRYSRESGYSRTDGMEGLVDEIRSMMQELPQNVQQDAQRLVQKLEQEM
ncbi:MAG: hypothetical protein J6S82_10635 [Bacteroidales bacterium]|nr:hypothetical protein [Bacteroidales bacterium]